MSVKDGPTNQPKLMQCLRLETEHKLLKTLTSNPWKSIQRRTCWGAGQRECWVEGFIGSNVRLW